MKASKCLTETQRESLEEIRNKSLEIHEILVNTFELLLMKDEVGKQELEQQASNLFQVSAYCHRAAEKVAELSQNHDRTTVSEFLDAVRKGKYTGDHCEEEKR